MKKKILFIAVVLSFITNVKAVSNVNYFGYQGKNICDGENQIVSAKIEYNGYQMFPLSPFNYYNINSYEEALFRGSPYEVTEVQDTLAAFPILMERFDNNNVRLYLTRALWEKMNPETEYYFCKIDGSKDTTYEEDYQKAKIIIDKMTNGIPEIEEGFLIDANNKTTYIKDLLQYFEIYDNGGLEVSLDTNDIIFEGGNEGRYNITLKRKTFGHQDPVILTNDENTYVSVYEYMQKKFNYPVNVVENSLIIHNSMESSAITRNACFDIMQNDEIIKNICVDNEGNAKTFLPSGEYKIINKNYTGYNGDFKELDIQIKNEVLDVYRFLNKDGEITYNPEDTLEITKIALVVVTLIAGGLIVYKNTKENNNN